MSCKSRTDVRRWRTLAALGVLASFAGGCSDLYYDRRETIALGADDHIAANQVTQMVDPWPLVSGNRNIAFNGERMQAAQERYRHGKVIPPKPPTTSSFVPAYSGAEPQQAPATHEATTPAAPVR